MVQHDTKRPLFSKVTEDHILVPGLDAQRENRPSLRCKQKCLFGLLLLLLKMDSEKDGATPPR